MQVSIGFHLSEGVRDHIKALADLQSVVITKWIRQAIDEKIERDDPYRKHAKKVRASVE